MKRILCFGDSNTWGFNPIDGSRYQADTRWTGVLDTLLGEEYIVIEEGLNGRTTVFDDPIDGYIKNGLTYFRPCIASQKPVDLVIIMLGTNDLKTRFGMGAYDIAAGAAKLSEYALASDSGPDNTSPEVLVISPIHVHKNILNRGYMDVFDESTYQKAIDLGQHMEANCRLQGCHYMAASDVAKPSAIDSIHMDAKDQKALGKGIYERVLAILG